MSRHAGTFEARLLALIEVRDDAWKQRLFPLILDGARGHVCDALCVCPIHYTVMYYWPAGGQHACQNPECPHARPFPA